jgi:spore maturation protein CgeB
MEMLRRRGHKVVILHTECPYEDEGQVMRAAYADLNILNDPISLDRFRAAGPPAEYIPHAYDPAIHYRRESRPDWESDFCFVGTGFPSRVAFLEAVDWSGIDFALAGMWARTDDESPLRKYLVHDLDHCLPNEDSVCLYSSTKASANLYRREAETCAHERGWAMGPREVELAALGTFFVRESRPEGDQLLPTLPVFDGPDDFAEKLRWWLAHDAEREAAAQAAQAAVADRTFVNNAKRLFQLLDL